MPGFTHLPGKILLGGISLMPKKSLLQFYNKEYHFFLFFTKYVILFTRGLCKPTFSTYTFKKLDFRHSVSVFFVCSVLNSVSLLGFCSRSSQLEGFLGKGVLKIYTKFAREHPCRMVISRTPLGGCFCCSYYLYRYQILFDLVLMFYINQKHSHMCD